jgi:hypothetical protein
MVPLELRALRVQLVLQALMEQAVLLEPQVLVPLEPQA